MDKMNVAIDAINGGVAPVLAGFSLLVAAIVLVMGLSFAGARLGRHDYAEAATLAGLTLVFVGIIAFAGVTIVPQLLS